MMMLMPRSVQITTPRASYEELVKQLRIPKARQRQLRAIVAETRRRLASEISNSPDGSVRSVEGAESAAVAR